MRIINHAYPQQQQQQQYLHHHQHQHLPQLPHHHPPQLPAPPHHPTPLPAIDNIDDNPSATNSTDDSSTIDHHPHSMSHTHDDRRVTHDHAPRSSYSNSPATLSHHERPSVDPTTLRSLLNDWRVDHHHPHPHLRNGDRDHKDFQPSTNNNKRKLEESHDELQSKIRRIVRDHLTMDYSRPMSMTTVICLHAAVAQKSYGSEKRFLCPPPVVRIETPYSELKNQHLAMSIVTESGERGPEQRSPLDNNMVANFKYLHVSGTAKSKSFQLALDIAESPLTHPTPSHLSPTDAVASTSSVHHHHHHAHAHEPSSLPGRIWASFDSAPVTIISKPSKKTAKTRNISSCILAGGPVSLFNRINSQTVRTKYMTIEHAQLCASNLSWSAFNVNVLRRPHDNMMISNQALQQSQSAHPHHPGSHLPLPAPPLPVIYGCEIQLLDTLTGIATSPLIIRKVDKGKVSPEDGGPVSQMQKIALQRVNPDGSRSYLSAASPVSAGVAGVGAGANAGGNGSGAGAGGGAGNGGGGAGSPGPPPPTPGSAGQPASHPLIFQAPRVREEVRDGVRMVTDEVDDYLCWTIVGISKFQYTFFDGSGTNSPIPRLPITPFPTLFTAPGYRPTPHTIELTVSNFFYTNPETMQHTPLEVWLGPIGPLRQRIFQATGPPGPLTNIAGLNGLPGSPIHHHPLPLPPPPQLSVTLNGLPSTLVNSIASSLNGMMTVGVGGMMNLYGQQGGGGGGGADGGSSEGGGGQGQNQISPTTTTTSQPPTPSGSGPLPTTTTGSSNSNSNQQQQQQQQITAPTPSPAIHSPTTTAATTNSSSSIPPPAMPPPPHSPPVAPPRFMPQGPLHTIIIVDLPPMSQIVRAARESVGLPSHLGYLGESVPGIPGLEMGVNLNVNVDVGANVNVNLGGVVVVDRDVKHDDGASQSSPLPPPPPPPPLPTLSPPPLPTLPILFMRPYDGIGYHSGRSIACEPSLSHEQVERIQRRVAAGAATGNGNGNGNGGVGAGSSSSGTGGKSGVKEEGAGAGAGSATGVSNGHGHGHGHGLLDGDIDWVVRVL